METIAVALAMILTGLVALYYLSLRPRPFDTVFVVLGVALVACGIAVFRDSVEGSRRILWVVGPGAVPNAGLVASEDRPGGRLP